MYSGVQSLLAGLEAEKGNVLTIDSTGLIYGANKAIDGSSVVSGQSLAQMGTRHAALYPDVLGFTAAPSDKVLPAITGDATLAGNVLTCSTGTWAEGSGAGVIAYTYQWKKDGTNIGGATASTYTLLSGDLDHSITCVVTATDAAGDATTATSAAVVAGIAPANTVAPVASGTGTVGQTLSVTNGTWTGTASIAFTYQWKRDGVNIAAATANSYVLVSGDSGHTVTCAVTGTNAVGAATAASNGIAVS